jgi:thermostable 8-oxoguanine DNA glycosylase
MKAMDCADLSDFLKDYSYHPELTPRLDALAPQPFTQSVVNEIVLWKLNRYALLNAAALEELNSVVNLQPGSHRSARDVILALLGERGVDLGMASTLLRFRNPRTFQIIDRHAYRALYGAAIRLSGSTLRKVELYLRYLDDLIELAHAKNVEFCTLDRVLYEFDRQKNGQR